MKKLVLFLFIAATFSVAGHSQSFNCDVDGDGSVTTADATAIFNFILGGDETFAATSDVDGDGYITVSDITSIYNILLGNVHEYVDLGLPSGTLWATTNIGADNPEDYGDYFAWGETTPKDVYNWSTYKWCNGSNNTLTKYCFDSSYGYNGFVDNKTELDPEDDAATANWGPEWCMPTKEQQDEVQDYCTSEWTTRNGVNGRLFTSTINGASLFLPAAGYRGYYGELYFAGSDGYSWSRTLGASRPYYAYFLSFGSGYMCWNYLNRLIGQSVRAVRVP